MKIISSLKSKLKSLSTLELISLILWLTTLILLIVTISLGVSIGSNKDYWSVVVKDGKTYKKFPDVVTVFILLFIGTLFGSLIFTVFTKYKEKMKGGNS